MKKIILISLFFQVLNASAQILDTGFPMVNGTVKTILVHGNTMYIGGEFTLVGGTPRSNIAAIDLASKSLTSWNPSTNDEVVDIEVADGKVYFCGRFNKVNTGFRNWIAAVDSITGELEPFNLMIGLSGGPGVVTVSSLEIIENSLYIAGNFNSVNGMGRNNVARLDLPSGSLTSFMVYMDKHVSIIEVDEKALYLGGFFSSITGNQRNGFAAVDRFYGEILPWAPKVSSAGGDRYCMVPDGDSIIFSGYFYDGSNSGNCYLEKTDLAGYPSNWAPFSCNGPYPSIRSILLSDSLMVIGGLFSNYSGINRKNLVIVHKHTGALGSWKPEPDGTVFSLAGNDSLIIVGGSFNHISGVDRTNLAVYNKNVIQSSTQAPHSFAGHLSGYPNPTQSVFTIPFDQTGIKNVSMFRKDGKLIEPTYCVDERSLLINTGLLQTGEYIVHIETANGKKYVAMFTQFKSE